MSEKDVVETAVTKGQKSIGALGLSGIAATVLVLVIVLAQMSGGIKLLGDWTESFSRKAQAELTLMNAIQTLEAVTAANLRFIRRHCQDHRDAGQKWADCSKL